MLGCSADEGRAGLHRTRIQSHMYHYIADGRLHDLLCLLHTGPRHMLALSLSSWFS